jgi:hypothetical protein
MTSESSAESDISEILQYMEHQLRSDADLRRQLTSAVHTKDESAMRKVATGIWKGLKLVAPFAFSVLLGLLGISTS